MYNCSLGLSEHFSDSEIRVWIREVFLSYGLMRASGLDIANDG